MPPEIVALIEKPWLLALVLSVGAISGIMVERISANLDKARRKAFWQGRRSGGQQRKTSVRSSGSGDKDSTDTAADQLRAVMRASFRARPLLNKPERRLLSVLDKAVAEENPGWRVMGQVSLGEILSSENKDAFWAINAKRVDLLIVDEDCAPVQAIEFQGTGHHIGEEAAARDAIKKEALRRAGIGYVEIVSGDTPADVSRLVRNLVKKVQAQ